MAAISAEGSQSHSYSDNPRTEDPEKILDDMESGITPDVRNKVLRIANRREAIKTAVMLAGSGDVSLLPGRGMRPYQEINGVKHHFDDREGTESCPSVEKQKIGDALLSVQISE